MGIGENIRYYRKQAHLTQEELAKMVGVGRPSVTQWETGAQTPLMGNVQKLAGALGVQTSDLVGEELIDPRKADGHPVRIVVAPGVPVPVVGRVHAGNFEPEEVAERVVHVTEEAVRGHPNAKGLIVDGHCMDRVIPEGCCVLYDPDMTEPANGSVVIVETEDYSALMRRWYSTGRTLVLSPDSFDADIEDIVLRWEDGPIRVLGTVFHFQAPDDWEEWIRLQDLTS